MGQSDQIMASRVHMSAQGLFYSISFTVVLLQPPRDSSSVSTVVQNVCTTVFSVSGGAFGESLFSFQSQKKTNGAPNGFYGDIDWDRYVSKNPDLQFPILTVVF